MTISTPPPPMDDPTVSDPLECPPMRWGILGCGKISHDFTQALKHLPTQTVVACSARSGGAKAFAEKHGIQNSYESYEEMLADSEIDIVYVGNIHSFRRETVEMCILANKNVLVEKPFACTVADGEYLIALAKERNLFVLEGMWTRFFPAVQQARNLIWGTEMEESAVGDIAMVYSDFNYFGPDKGRDYPTNGVYNRKLGGGTTLLIGPYPIASSILCFKNPPDSVKVVGQVDEETGVDLQASVVLSFPPTRNEHNGISPKLPGSGIACLSYGVLCPTPEETKVVGTKGRITIETPCHCPTKLSVHLKAHGRGQGGLDMVYEYPLPEDTEEIKAAGGYCYFNSSGFIYEAAAVARCIAAGKKEAPQFTLEETMLSLKLSQEFRNQLGVKPIAED